MKIAVAVIVKNECPSLLEWIAYHRAVGIDHFIVMDNHSDDGTWVLLKQLKRRGLVWASRFQTLAGMAPQIDAYQAILTGPARDFDVVVFLDADEYLYPTDGETSVRPAIEHWFSDPEVSSVAMNWACFGSSGAVFRAPGLVPERFLRRAEQGHPMNRHYKSMVRPSRVARFVNPHEPWLTEGRSVNTAGHDLIEDPNRPHGFSQSLCWERLRVNHYVVKSLEEFLVRKSRVGNASWPEKKKHRAFFEGHDRNEIEDDSILPLIPHVWAEYEKLNNQLSQMTPSERLSRAVGKLSIPARLQYARFLWRRLRLYGAQRLKHGPLSLKSREER